MRRALFVLAVAVLAVVLASCDRINTMSSDERPPDVVIEN